MSIDMSHKVYLVILSALYGLNFQVVKVEIDLKQRNYVIILVKAILHEGSVFSGESCSKV